MKFIQNPCRNDRHILLFLFTFWFLTGLVLSGIAFATSYDTAAKVAVSGPGSTFDFWWTNQRNPFYGGRNWNTPPEWVKQKGPVGVPNPRSAGTPGDFTSGVAKIPGYKPGGNVPVGEGVRQTPLDPIKDWEIAGNPAHVPAGKGVRPLESVSGVTGGGSGGSQWFEAQQQLNVGGKAAGTTPGSGEPIYPVGGRLTPFKPGQKLTGEEKAIYDGLIKDGIPHRAPPSGAPPAGSVGAGTTPGSGEPIYPVGGRLTPFKPGQKLTGEEKAIYDGLIKDGIPHRAPPSATPPAGSAGKGPGPAPKSGIGSVIGKLFIGLMVINSAVNIATSDKPGEQAKEEGRGWFTGIIGSIMGGLITGGPVGGFIGAIIGVTTTDKNFADYAMGNNQDYQNQQARERLTGPKTLEGEQRVTQDNLKKNLPGFGSTDITPPGTQTAAGTADIGTPGGSANEGETADGTSSGLDWAQNVNVTSSYKEGMRTKAKGKAKENLKNSGLTTSERVATGEGEDQRKKGQIASQGMETGQSISSTQQEGKKAQDTDRIMSETSIGTILAGGLMGGLSSGVATGLDSFFGTLGQGAGGQVSVSAGIQPPPPPNAEPTSGSGASTGIGSSSGTGATNTTATSNGIGKSSGVTGSSGVGTSTGVGASSVTATSGVSGTTATTAKPTTKVTKPTTTTTAATVTKPTSAATKPTNTATKPTTTTTKTTVTEGSKPDCAQYRISAENLSSQYERGSISTSSYKAQMGILRTKYKGCQETARTPTTSETSKTSTQGSTTKKPTEKTMQSCGQAPIDVWHCHGYTGSCCTKGWHCEGNNCGPLDPAVYKATHDCMKKLGIIR